MSEVASRASRQVAVGRSSPDLVQPESADFGQGCRDAFLRSGVHGVVIGDDLALIDLQADAYLCVPGGLDSVRVHPGPAMRLGGPVARSIAEAGLAASEPHDPPKALPPRPVRTIIHEPPEPFSALEILNALGAAREVRRRLRSPGLLPILGVAGAAPGNDPAGAVRAAKALWRIAPWLPIEGECLVRSALLMSFLRRSGFAADWVFGVRLWPFSAHCWVQSGDVCLNDDVERLAAYTPIYCR